MIELFTALSGKKRMIFECGLGQTLVEEVEAERPRLVVAGHGRQEVEPAGNVPK